jgi:chromosome segregation ATPase
LESHPQLLEAYLDLELSAELFGGVPDTGYVQRLNAAVVDSQALLQSWWQPMKQVQTARTEHHVLKARAEALEEERGQWQEEGERRLRHLHQTQEELERLFAADQEKAQRIEELQARVDGGLKTVTALETELGRIGQLRDGLAQERDGLVQEREALAGERDGLARERDGLAKEGEVALSQVAKLTQQLKEQEEALRRALEGEAGLKARAEALEEERGQWQVERLGMVRQLQQAQQELEGIFLADQDKASRIGELQATLDSQTSRVRALDADLARTGRERDVLAKEKVAADTLAVELNQQLTTHMEALRLLREVESSLHARAAALDGEKRKRQEEVDLTLQQLHQTQEELEKYFLLAKSSDQLVAAQQEQLQRAQTLMSRLLCQISPGQALPQAMAVEVLPPALQPSRIGPGQRPLLHGKEGKMNWASQLLRRVRGS